LEVKDFLLKDNNLKTLLNIEASIIEAKIEIQLMFWRELMNNLQPHYKFDFFNENEKSTIEKSVNKYYKKQKNKKEYGYKYQLDKNLYFFIQLEDEIFYGFDCPDEDNILDTQIDKLEQINVNEGKDWKYTDKRLNFEEFNTPNVLNLLDKTTREEDIETISNEIIDLIRQYNK
jgi:hypothetical protein